MAETNYRPALTMQENQRADELMALLAKVQKKEDEVKKELRKLMYKVEEGR